MSKRGKPKVNVPKDDLIKAIEEVEASGPKNTRQELWQAVENTDWAKNFQPKPLTASVIMLRVQEYGIEVKTPKGKRGRQKGFKPTGVRTSRREKFANNPQIQKGLKELRAKTPDRYLHIVDQIDNGSQTAALKLHCIECSGGSQSEARNCEIQSCALWAFRPREGHKQAA